jgi:hypothetical protein
MKETSKQPPYVPGRISHNEFKWRIIRCLNDKLAYNPECLVANYFVCKLGEQSASPAIGVWYGVQSISSLKRDTDDRISQCPDLWIEIELPRPTNEIDARAARIRQCSDRSLCYIFLETIASSQQYTCKIHIYNSDHVERRTLKLEEKTSLTSLHNFVFCDQWIMSIPGYLGWNSEKLSPAKLLNKNILTYFIIMITLYAQFVTLHLT